jgi:hypothetical protein
VGDQANPTWFRASKRSVVGWRWPCTSPFACAAARMAMASSVQSTAALSSSPPRARISESGDQALSIRGWYRARTPPGRPACSQGWTREVS